MPLTASVPEGEIDLFLILQLLLKSRRWVTIATLTTTIFAGSVAFLTTPTYRAETLLVPATNENSGNGLSALAGQYTALASLAGTPVGVGGDKDVAIATLQSRELIEQFVRDNNLLPVLFENKWDSEHNRWRSDNLKKIPDLLDAHTLFIKKILTVTNDTKTGLVTVAVEWKSPQLAAQWANELVRRTNEHLRNKTLAETDRNLAYLQDEAQKTSVVEIRQTIYKLMEEQLKKAMVAKGNDQYAFKVIDPAQAPRKQIRPKRALIIALGFLGGLFLSIVTVLMRNAFNEGRQAASPNMPELK